MMQHKGGLEPIAIHEQRAPRLAVGRPLYMAKKFPTRPANPHRICWGCDKYCPVESLACGNGSDRTQHPVELFGEGWEELGLDAELSVNRSE